MESSTVQIAQALVALTALLVSAALTVFVYYGMRKAAYLQFWRSVGNAWMDIDKFALSNDQNLRLADSLFNPDKAHQSIEHIRKRWFSYMVVNVFHSMYYGTNVPLPGPERRHAERARLELRPLLKDDVFYDLTQSGILEDEFERMCRDLRKEQGLPTD
jgi:hypothetical protein